MAKVVETVNMKGVLYSEELILEGKDDQHDLNEYLQRYNGRLVTITIKVQKED